MSYIIQMRLDAYKIACQIARQIIASICPSIKETEMREYRHLLFAKNWDLTPPTWTDIGVCEGIIRSITRTPILPDHYQRLLRLSLHKGAQSTTAIEGNTLSDEEI